ncbi:MAG: HDOD domain-containing protein [Gammaproteobacteria bacterium]|nr:HDOD domain-containing protein [Gammaproteobacteria bacterium]
MTDTLKHDHDSTAMGYETSSESSAQDETMMNNKSIEEIRRQVESVYELPMIPDMASRILQLSADPAASVKDVVEVVEMDPSLAAQVIRYARSPFFGYQGDIDTIHEAISRVLGFDLVMNIALGISSGKIFNIPDDGPLGTKAFWRHAVYTAALTQALGKAMPRQMRPKAGTAYLTGLLHNIGFMLLGHLFRPEFMVLNKLAAARPNTSIAELEKRILGMGHAKHVVNMGHCQLGDWLMQSWKMPREVIVTVREHHNEDYKGEHCVYSRLTMVANRMLKRHGIGDARSEEVPEHILKSLYLSEELVERILEQIMDGGEALDVMAQQIAA